MATIEKYYLTPPKDPESGEPLLDKKGQPKLGELRYRVRYRTPGRRQTDKRGFRTKALADAFAATVEVSKLQGEYVAPAAGRVSVGEWVLHWRSGREGELSRSTAERYDGIIRTHIVPKWGAVMLSDIRHSDVQDWISKVVGAGSSPATARKVHRVLSLALDLAVVDRRLTSNPASKVKIARPKVAARRYLTHNQVDRLAAEAGELGKPVILVLAYCGLRWGELAALKVGAVDVKRARIRIRASVTEVGGRLEWGEPKTKQHRTVPLPEFLVPLVADRIQGRSPDELAFPAAGGGVLRYRVARRSWFDAAVIASGAPEGFHPHELRHTAASLAISAGANVLAVQHLLGHSSAAMTLDTYSDLFPDDLDAVAVGLNDARSREVVGKSVGTDQKSPVHSEE